MILLSSYKPTSDINKNCSIRSTHPRYLCHIILRRYFIGRNIVIRALRPLKPGDVIAENYGPIFTKKNFKERQRSLMGRYWFRCSCIACVERWPGFEDLTNETVRLRYVNECLRVGNKTNQCTEASPKTIWNLMSIQQKFQLFFLRSLRLENDFPDVRQVAARGYS